MRNTKRIMLANKDYELRELNVNDIFVLYQNFGDVTENIVHTFIRNKILVTSIIDVPWEDFLELRVSEVKKFYDEIIQLNNQFFSNRKKKSKTSGTGTTSKEFTKGLFTLCCTMIEAGHKDVFTYGYSFFIQAINNYEKIKNGNIAEVATSVRMAYHSDNKEWKKYIRSLVGFYG